MKKNKVALDMLFFMVLSVAVLIYSFRLYEGGALLLSPALFPATLGCILLFIGTLGFINVKTTQRGAFKLRGRPMFFLGISLVYLVLLPVLHFPLATFLYISLCSVLFGGVAPIVGIAAGMVTSLGAYGVFQIVFRVILP